MQGHTAQQQTPLRDGQPPRTTLKSTGPGRQRGDQCNMSHEDGPLNENVTSSRLFMSRTRMGHAISVCAPARTTSRGERQGHIAKCDVCGDAGPEVPLPLQQRHRSPTTPSKRCTRTPSSTTRASGGRDRGGRDEFQGVVGDGRTG